VDRSKDVQDLQEQCCARLGANLLFVATGQNALAGTPLLLRLQELVNFCGIGTIGSHAYLPPLSTTRYQA
jgi:hypothetical protein